MFETPEDFQLKADQYFEWVKGESRIEKRSRPNKDGSIEKVDVEVWERAPEPITITGLALFLGFSDRQSLNDYEDKIEFSFIVKRARLRVENGYEKALHLQSPTGAIFALKNMGWNDKQQVDHTTAGESFNLHNALKNFMTDEGNA